LRSDSSRSSRLFDSGICAARCSDQFKHTWRTPPTRGAAIRARSGHGSEFPLENRAACAQDLGQIQRRQTEKGKKAEGVRECDQQDFAGDRGIYLEPFEHKRDERAGRYSGDEIHQ